MNKGEMLVPLPQRGTATDIDFSEVGWMEDLPRNTYFALWQRVGDDEKDDLPLGYDLYVVSWHLENVHVEWISRQARRIGAPMIVLSDVDYYDYSFPDNVRAYTWYYWHRQIEKIKNWHGPRLDHRLPRYKFSAVCNRVTQSKVWTVTKLLDSYPQDSLIILGGWFEEKNVHDWAETGLTKLDQLTSRFRDRYHGRIMKIDGFDNGVHNYQKWTSNPWQPLYLDAALHFTNESWHYSFVVRNDVQYITPGPFITEKTFKCLVAGQGFVPVGQFDTYGKLRRLGFEFDYGFDTSWDQDPGDLTRFSKIIDTVDEIGKLSAEEIYHLTEDSSKHNLEHIHSGGFSRVCLANNLTTVETIFRDLAL